MKRMIEKLKLKFTAASPAIVFCGTQGGTPCTLCDLLKLVKNVVDFVLYQLTPVVAVIMVLISGILIMININTPATEGKAGYAVGMRLLKNTLVAVIIIYCAWLITNTFIQIIAGSSNTAKSWFVLECTNPEPLDLKPGGIGGGTGGAGGANPQTPYGSVTPGGFRNAVSPELAALQACLETRVAPGSRTLTSTTDDNIAGGRCDPLDPNERFQTGSGCQHRKFSCHYGCNDPVCQKKGSYALDYVGDYATLRAAALVCNPKAFVLDEYSPRHIHISIGGASGCAGDDK